MPRYDFLCSCGEIHEIYLSYQQYDQMLKRREPLRSCPNGGVATEIRSGVPGVSYATGGFYTTDKAPGYEQWKRTYASSSGDNDDRKRASRRGSALVLALLLLAGTALSALANSEQVVPTGVGRIGGPAAGDVDLDVAVIDTGIEWDNPDLNVVGGVDCTNVIEKPQLPYPPTVFTVQGGPVRPMARPIVPAGAPGWTDGYGHGTHVAGTIAAKDNDRGVVGVVPGARLWSVRVLDSSGSGTEASVNCGLKWVLRNADTVDIVNMSLGGNLEGKADDLMRRCTENGVIDPRYLKGEVRYDETRDLICRLRDKGIPVVVAAGNENAEAVYHTPGGIPEAVTVSNFSDFDGAPGGRAGVNDLRGDGPCSHLGGQDDMLWVHDNGTPEREYTSSYGEGIDVSGPGTCILSTVPGGFAYFTGTSMATPHVTGALGWYLSEHPDATVDEAVAWLLGEAEPQGPNFGDVDRFREPIVHLP